MSEKSDLPSWVKRYQQRRRAGQATYNQKRIGKAELLRRQGLGAAATAPLEPSDIPRPKSKSAPVAARVKLYWWNGMGGRNFGDVLSRYIVRAALGRPVVHASSSPRLLAVGSILRLAKPGDMVWGSGLSMPSPVQPHVEIRAVRGPLTRSEVVGQGLSCPQIYGDPALLVGRIFDSSDVTKDGRVGVLPHYVDKEMARRLCGGAKINLIDVLAEPAKVIAEICKCSIVYSSSLHGIICAEAMGVPAVWVQFSDGVRGGVFKFKDYYLASNRSPPRPLNWREHADPTPNFEAPDASFPDLDALLLALPGAKSGPLAKQSLRKIRL